ncbi:MAG: fumarylacetoacetate hydrolase family protein [Rhodospirillaceae bacterium]|jgi:2-keto-4-pentenoate hydratase/2-oxohepta-3-ene-1,7-dioic acid hydratase in catechol pathway|nr:fumarylacetoacetate hydrolase family protein [Rhodospirillaceae bacterium]
MKLATFTQGGMTRVGVVTGEEILDLSAAAPDLPTDMKTFLRAGEVALEKAARATGRTFKLSDVRLETPVPNAEKYLAIGLNYESHLEEVAKLGMTKPESQIWFNKQVSCLNGPYDEIYLPKESSELDYECELGVVIGTRCRRVSVEDAVNVIAGFTVTNDVSIRDWQMRSPTATLGKSWDTHGPVGPWIVTPDEVGDPLNLAISTTVDGDVRQKGNTGEMIFNCYEQISYLSTVMTLEPGDILATGTPAGVGALAEPQNFLKAGETVRIEIENIGAIENKVINEPI